MFNLLNYKCSVNFIKDYLLLENNSQFICFYFIYSIDRSSCKILRIIKRTRGKNGDIGSQS